MGNEIVYCSVCGDRLSTADFKKGKAVTLLKKNFCTKCAEAVAQESSEGPAYDPTVTPKPIKIRTQRIPIADGPKPADARLSYLIAAAIAAVALLLFYVLFIKN